MNTTSLEACPTCGQTLQNRDAIERVRQSQASQQREFERRLAAEASVQAERLMAGKLEQLKQEAAKAQGKRVKALEGALQKEREDRLQLERRLEKMSANERGELHEIDVFQQLVQAFPADKIERRRRGSDIVQTVHYDAGGTQRRAGTILYECKDTVDWRELYIRQIRAAGTVQRTPYLVLVSRATPKGEDAVSVKEGVVVVRPRHALAIADIVRRMVIEAHRAGLATDRLDQKNARLLKYVGSEHFRENFGALGGLSDTVAGILADEKRYHQRNWTRREQAYDEMARRYTAVDEAIRGIVEEVTQGEGKVIPLKRRAS